MKVVISEYAKYRSRAFLNWFPDAIVRRRYEGERLPGSFDLLILTGGPISAHEESRRANSFLADDLVLLQELSGMGDKAPFTLGVCLGAQLMTFAFGGFVEDGKENLVGWNDINLVDTHPAFEGMDRLLHCEIHANHIVQLPDQARLLASSAFDAIEVFSIGNRMLGTAYHPEVTKYDIAWFAENTGLKLDFLKPTNRSLDDGYEASRKFFENITSLATL